ncbi:sphingomyelin phosphodiesterase [Vibrio jasicida]|uniref:sphingomyelin phosphodiesterase n=1 Tax=Vibrio jasicida TaxID=766224 RepID=UPI000CE3A4D9|nr:sphingomyelin phosphodiesterase [Vibrio jasicida]
MIRKFSYVVIFWLISYQASSSSVYYINRTSLPVKVIVRASSTASVEEGKQYQLYNENMVISAYGRAKVADINRYNGLESGHTYDFDFFLSYQNPDGSWDTDLRLIRPRVRLEANIYGSRMLHGFSSRMLAGHSEPLTQDVYLANNKHREFGIKPIYRAGFDDIEIVISEHEATKVEHNPNVLNIASYNLWMIPSISLDIYARAKEIDHYLTGYDVLVLQEAFSGYREELFDDLAFEYPYKTDVLNGGGGALYDGGIITMSKYPIIDTDYLVFEHCTGTDCYADKGIVYVKINKNGVPYHIFNTHLASYETLEAKRLRRLQLGLLRTFMLTKQIPEDEAVIYAGDFNIDKNSDVVEYLLMLATLEVSPPEYRGYTLATFDPNINKYARAQYSGGVKAEFLDYIFVSNRHRQAFSNTNTVKLMQKVSSDTWGKWHLSDHFSVIGHFIFDE